MRRCALRWTAAAAAVLTFALWTLPSLACAHGLSGRPPSVPQNLAPWVVFVWLWVGGVVSSGLAGDVWQFSVPSRLQSG